MGNHNPDPWRRRSPASDVRLESERAEQQITDFLRAIATARAEGRKDGLREAAKLCDRGFSLALDENTASLFADLAAAIRARAD